MTTRRWMALVAVAAVAFEARNAWKRYGLWLERAEFHAAQREALGLVRLHGFYPYCSRGVAGIPLTYDVETAPIHARLTDYHTLAERVYRRAAWRWWEQVPSLALDPDADDLVTILA